MSALSSRPFAISVGLFGRPVSLRGVLVNKFPRMADEKKRARGAPPGRKHGKRPARTQTGELWARCPECRMPVKDAELFKHLLNCPGAEVRQAEWTAQQAAAKPEVKTETEAQAE